MALGHFHDDSNCSDNDQSSQEDDEDAMSQLLFKDKPSNIFPKNPANNSSN
jgi:hypothetical protein